jgi:hypothetical protein
MEISKFFLRKTDGVLDNNVDKNSLLIIELITLYIYITTAMLENNINYISEIYL